LQSPKGSPFYSVWPGEVTWASNMREGGGGVSDYGYHVKIDHPWGDRTVYAHASSDLQVKVGDVIEEGVVIGFSGNTGNSTGHHLHFEIRRCPGAIGFRQCQVDPYYFLFD
jgi:murein DD-endopeptidase MepM/ murein hydrolase activator NlpD